MCYNNNVERGTPHGKRCIEVTLRRVATEKEIGRLFSPSQTTNRYINQQTKDDPQGFGLRGANLSGYGRSRAYYMSAQFSWKNSRPLICVSGVRVPLRSPTLLSFWLTHLHSLEVGFAAPSTLVPGANFAICTVSTIFTPKFCVK